MHGPDPELMLQEHLFVSSNVDSFGAREMISPGLGYSVRTDVTEEADGVNVSQRKLC